MNSRPVLGSLLAAGALVVSGCAIQASRSVPEPKLTLTEDTPVAEPTLDDAIARAWLFDLPAPALTPAVPPARLWATSYYVPVVTSVPTGEPLLDPSGASLGPRIAERDWCEAALEGTVVVRDPASGAVGTFNYATSATRTQVPCKRYFPKLGGLGKSRFRLAQGPYGDGVEGMTLVPYRTVAVDPERVPFGTVLYIPAARGVVIQLPNGEYRIHDGYFFAADRGGAIRENHIDVFSGFDREPPLEFVQSRASATFDAYRIRDPAIEELLLRAHRPPFQAARHASRSPSNGTAQ